MQPGLVSSAIATASANTKIIPDDIAMSLRSYSRMEESMNEPDPGAHSIDRWGYFAYSKESNEKTIDTFFSEALKRPFVHKDIRDACDEYKRQKESLTTALDLRLKNEFSDSITIEELKRQYNQRN